MDSDYAGDTTYRKSVTGIALRMAGGTILYCTKFQEVVAMSSTEAEFIAAAEAGKQILYIRSILEEISVPQHEATTLYEDNQGALLMANAQKPTKRTKHMDTRHFALQDWVNRDLLTLKHITTQDNYADAMTKALSTTLFYRHMDFIQGRVIPAYAYAHKQWQQPCNLRLKQQHNHIRLLVIANHSTQDNTLSPSSEQGRELCRIQGKPHIKGISPFFR